MTDHRPDEAEAPPDRRWPAGARTTLELRSGRLIVAKRRPAQDRPATEAEGRWLAAARHPGVVHLRRVALADGLIETELAGLPTFAVASLDRTTTALVLADVARTVTELHRRGLVHGQLWPEHVVLAGPRRSTPMLCSPRPPACGPDRRHDVVDLANMARDAANRWAGNHWTGSHWAGDRHWSEVVDQLTHDPRATPAHAARCFDGLARARSGRRRFRPRWPDG